MEQAIVNQTQLVEIFTLKYDKFLKMIDELNSIAQYFLDEDGSQLAFEVARGSDVTFLWRLTVRIRCSRYKNDLSNIINSRLLNLNQFLNVYNTIKQQSETLKIFSAAEEEAGSEAMCSGGVGTGVGSCSLMPSHTCGSKDQQDELINESLAADPSMSSNSLLKESKLFDMIRSMSEQTPNDDDICCICMEEKTNLILACTHNFCEKCINNWKITSKTCPTCRKLTEDRDCFILTEKPDYYNLQDEMSKSLFQITNATNKKNEKKRRSNQLEQQQQRDSRSNTTTTDDTGFDSD